MNKERFNWESRSFQFLVLGFLAIIWGSSFLLMKKGLVGLSHTEVASWRLFFAFLFLILISAKSWKAFRKEHLIPLIVVALFGNGIPAFLFTKAISGLDSSITGILNSLVPVFTLTIGLVWFKIRVRWYNISGVLIGLFGAIVLFAPQINLGQTNELSFAIYPVLAALCYAISLNTIKYYLQDMKAMAITVIAFSFVGPLGGGYALLPRNIIHLSSTEAQISLIYIAVLAIVGTAIAVLIFNKLVKHTTALFASSVTYLIPVVAIFWGIIDGEVIDWNHWMGMAVILGGVWLVNKKAI